MPATPRRSARAALLLAAVLGAASACGSDPLQDYLADVREAAQDQGVPLPADGTADAALLQLGRATCELRSSVPMAGRVIDAQADAQPVLQVVVDHCDSTFAEPFTPEQVQQYGLDRPLPSIPGLPDPGTTDLGSLADDVLSGLGGG